MQDRIDQMFIKYAADVLGDTSIGLSGSEIVAVTTGYAVEHGVSIPHQEYPFEAGNKRTALRENLRAFPPSLQFEIILALCDHRQVVVRNPEGVRKLKLQLLTWYGHLASQPCSVRSARKLSTIHVTGWSHFQKFRNCTITHWRSIVGECSNETSSMTCVYL